MNDDEIDLGDSVGECWVDMVYGVCGESDRYEAIIADQSN